MSNSFNTVSIVGLGYIGLPTAAMLASRRINVVGVDVNQHAVDTINRGEIHIVEPELDMIVRAVVSQGYLIATTTPKAADAFLIAVPTPFMGDHEPDISYIESAAKSIAPVLKKGDLVILESTSPVGTTEQMANWFAEARPDLTFPQQTGDVDINIAYCPERVLPGKVVQELVNNDRVIGGMTELCTERAIELYKVFVEGECIATNAPTAEMCKLTENAFRDVNIAIANELSIICDKLDINVWELIKLANRHPRVNILQPGPGVGGHCIAVDPWFIVSKTPKDARLISMARQVNDGKPSYVASMISEAASSISQPVIACLGLAFKPDIDDLRESPAMDVVRLLTKGQFGRLLLVEPHISKLPGEFSELSNVELVPVEEAIEQSEIIAMLVSHKDFFEINPQQLEGKRVIDTRGVWQ